LIPAQAVFFGVALAIGKALLLSPEENDPHMFPKPIHCFLAGFAVVISFQTGKVAAYFKTERAFFTQPMQERKSFVARRVMRASRPGDTLSIWGWMPEYYLETGLMPATRDAIGHFIVEKGPYQTYFQERYLEDLKQSKPAIFIDAMADGVNKWRKSDFNRHESFPELAKFIDENYSLWLTVHIITEKSAGVPVRIYLLKGRMAELNLLPQELTIPLDPSLAPE
jgi:hypothetical protein